MTDDISEETLVMCDECGWVWVDGGEEICPNCGGKDLYEAEEEKDD